GQAERHRRRTGAPCVKGSFRRGRLTAVRLGRARQRCVAVITAVGLAVIAGPAASADRKAYYPRNPNGDRASHRNPDADQSSRRQYGDPPADEGLPAEFVAELHARIVVVSAATGRVV